MINTDNAQRQIMMRQHVSIILLLITTSISTRADLSEEVVNAGEAIPLAIMVGSITTAILGFFVNVALCYGIKNISALPGPTGLVVPQILWDNLGQAGGLVVFSFIIAVQAVVAMTCQLSSIRCVFLPIAICLHYSCFNATFISYIRNLSRRAFLLS